MEYTIFTGVVLLGGLLYLNGMDEDPEKDDRNLQQEGGEEENEVT